jgi:RND family efflux transporter MFP subunit
LPKEEEVLAPPLIQPQEISYRTLDVKRGEIVDRLSVIGYFVYVDQEPLYFKHRSGRLKDIYVSYGDEVSKGTLLAELDTGNLDLDIQQQQIRLRQRELSYERMKLRGADRYELEMAQLDIDLANLGLQQLQQEKLSARLYAPMDGEIVYIARVDPGNYVDAFRTVIQIADPTKLMISYNGSNLSEFRAGMPVNIRALREEYSGKVAVTPMDFPLDTPEEQRRQVLIEVNGLGAGNVSKGSSATIELIRARREDTIVIPRNQVQFYMGRKFVYVLEDGIRAERNIETGIETSTEVEVLKGLEEGDILVLR